MSQYGTIIGAFHVRLHLLIGLGAAEGLKNINKNNVL